jgi:hypothetical protein
MANTFTKSTKSSLVTADVTSSATTNVVTAGSTATLIILSILVSNKTGSSANGNIYLLPSSGDAAFLIKNAPIPAGSSLEMISGSKVIMTANDVLRASSDTSSALDITVSYLQQT